MESTPEVFTDKIPMSSGLYVRVKNLVRRNHSVNFKKQWTSNQRLIYTGHVLLKKSARQSEQIVCCGPVYQNDAAIKINKCVKKIFTNGLYTILRLYSLQYLMIVTDYL